MKKIGIGVLILFFVLIIIISILVQQRSRLIDENNYLDEKLNYYREQYSNSEQQYVLQYDMTWFVSYNYDELLNYSNALLERNDEMTFDDRINLLEKYGLKRHFYDKQNYNNSSIRVIDNDIIEFSYAWINTVGSSYGFIFYFVADPNESNIENLDECVKIGENFFIAKYKKYATGLGH